MATMSPSARNVRAIQSSSPFEFTEVGFEFAAATDIESGAMKRTAEWRIVKKWASDRLKSPIAKRGDKGPFTRLNNNPFRVKHENVDADPGAAL